MIHADLLAHRIVREAEGEVKIANDADMQARWQAAADELGLDYRGEFLANEWEQVILAQGCRSAPSTSRPHEPVAACVSTAGHVPTCGAPSNTSPNSSPIARSAPSSNLPTLPPGTSGAERCGPTFTSSSTAQDMHEAQWRMLRAAVADAPNDMFLVGDSHQRIYDRRSSLSKVGINIRGRSHKLRINYRTTHEILRWSLGLLGTYSYDDLDEGEDTHDFAGYHSLCTAPSRHCRGLRAGAPKSTPSSSR